MINKAQLLNQQPVKEKKLFHGTRAENVEAICKDNFDPRINKRNRPLMLGQGTYFAVNALLSHSYAKRDPNLFQYMFLAKVLVGSYTEGRRSGLHSNQRLPPEDCSNVDTDLYDAYVDEISNPSVFVVFERNHFYPEYVIQYLETRPPYASDQIRSVQRLTPFTCTQSSFSTSAVSISSRFGSLSCYATLAKANSSTTQEMPMTSGIEHGILKHWSCSSNFLGKASLPSGSTTQSSNSASAVYKAEHTGTSWTKSSNNLDRTSGGTGAENSHSVSALFTSEFASVETQLNAKKISMQKGTVAKRSHSTSVVSGSELTSVNLTTRTKSWFSFHAERNWCRKYLLSLFYFLILF